MKKIFALLFLCCALAYAAPAQVQVFSAVRPGSKFVKLVDKNYVPFKGTSIATADVLFSSSSNDNNQNALGTISTSKHFFNAVFDTKIDASGADKWYTGLFNQIRVGGTAYSGSAGYIRGIWNMVNNRQNLTATPTIYGIDSSVSVEGHATAAYGAQFTVFKGSAVTANKLVGLVVQSSNAYSNADEITGIDAWTRTINPGFAPTTTLMRSIWAHTQQVNGTVTTLRTLDISGNSLSAGSVTKYSAIYIGSDVNIAATNYAIESLSTAPSVLTGDLTIGGSGKFFVSTAQTPSSASAACTTGQIAWDSSAIYVCVATNTWKKTALATF